MIDLYNFVFVIFIIAIYVISTTGRITTTIVFLPMIVLHELSHALFAYFTNSEVKAIKIGLTEAYVTISSETMMQSDIVTIGPFITGLLSLYFWDTNYYINNCILFNLVGSIREIYYDTYYFNY